MDKLDNETWEEYALRHNLFKIKYTDADNSIIDDIYIYQIIKLLTIDIIIGSNITRILRIFMLIAASDLWNL